MFISKIKKIFKKKKQPLEFLSQTSTDGFMTISNGFIHSYNFPYIYGNEFVT